MKFFSWLLLIVLCIAVLGGLAYFKYSEIRAAIEMGKAFPEPVETIEVVLAQKSVYQPTTRVTGEVVALQAADVTNELAGRIVEVGFAPGAKVSKGQLLLALDTTEEAARLRAARADQEIAELGFDRSESLMKRGVGSAQDRDTTRAQFASASANAETLQAIIDKKQITAPFDATTSLHRLEVGQYLAANTTVARLVGINEQTWIDFALPQQEANSISGDSVEVLEGTTVVGKARLIGQDAAINSDSRNLSFRALLDSDPEKRLYPGELVSVRVALGELLNVVAVPATAVRKDALGAVVYVIATGPASKDDAKKSGNAETEALRAHRRSVTVGDNIDFDPTTQQQFVVIESGLEPGERIAANGAFKLRDGIKVNLLEQGPSLSVQESAQKADTGAGK